MKDEKWVREYLAALRKARNSPCDCSGAHRIGCMIGGRMMDASLETLLVVLGESPDGERVANAIMEGNK